MKNTKNIIIIGKTTEQNCMNIQESFSLKNKNWQVRNLVQKDESTFKLNPFIDEIDFDNSEELANYFDSREIVSVTARTDSAVALLIKTLPHIPSHVFMPNEKALERSLDKTKMRKSFRKHNPAITPLFFVLDSFDKKIIDEKIDKKLEYPVIVKPSGLASSMLVQWAHSKQELEDILKNTFNKIDTIYKEKKGRGIPRVLVEEFIEGDVYSLDVHVDKDYNCSFYPIVKYHMAHQKGFDDFFVYDVSTPVFLKESIIEDVQHIATEGVKALGLTNSTAHIELIKNKNNEWRIIEIGPRLGGNRPALYKQSFGVDLNTNDILIHAGKKISIPKKIQGYSSTMRFYAKSEGFIKKISGIKMISKLPSFINLDKKLGKGDKCLHAKNGGVYVFKVNLFNTDKDQLTADKRTIAKTVHIETVKQRKNI